jgi:hypothetical protein
MSPEANEFPLIEAPVVVYQLSFWGSPRIVVLGMKLAFAGLPSSI